VGAKGLGLAGPDSRDAVASGVKWGPHGGKKARRSRRPETVQGSGSRQESARGVCGGSPKNRRVILLSHKTKTGGSAGGDGIRARREASMPADTWRREDAVSGNGVAMR
jgi:hypothetical protein